MSDSGPLTQQQAMALLRRTTDAAWLSAMLASPDGAAIIASKLAVFEAASLAVTAQANATMISTAPTGRSGVCTLTLQRSDTSASATIPKGYTFITNLGVELTVACDVQIASGQATVALPLITTRQIDLVNTPGPAFDDILKPGDSVAPIVGPANQPTSYAWTPTGPLTTARGLHTSTPLPNGNIFICGGYGASGVSANCEVWNASTQTSASVGNMHVARIEHQATLLKPTLAHPLGLVLITGGAYEGQTYTGMADAEIYDPVANTFTVIPGGMTIPRAGHTATLLPIGKVLIAGGNSDYAVSTAACELYDPVANSFTATGSMHTARWLHLAAPLPSGNVMVAGGETDAGIDGPIPPYLASAEVYNVSTGTWAITGDMTIARNGFDLPASGAIALQDGDVLIVGGITGNDNLGENFVVASMERYNETRGTFVSAGNMSDTRWLPGLALLSNGQVVISGGYGGTDGAVNLLATVDIYDPVAGTCTATAPMSTVRSGHSESSLPDGTAVAMGGYGNASTLASAEVFGDFIFLLTYVSSTQITGAVEDWLSALGNERGCIRQDGEDGEAYRARVRMIPDAVSPLAIARAVDATATALPERWLAEPFNDGADPNVKLAANLGFFDGFFCDSDFCDDPLGVSLADKQPVANLECSGIRESRAYVRVDLVGQLQEPDGLVLYCDDGFCDDPQWGYPDVHTHPVIQGAEQALLQQMQLKVAGGVNFDVYLENSETLVQQGTLSGTTSAGGTPVITLTPVAGTAWYLREGLLTADMGNRHWAVTGQGIAVRLTLDDGSTLQTPWAQGVVSLRSYELEALGYRGQRVTSIECLGLTLYDLEPPYSMNLIGSFTVNTATL